MRKGINMNYIGLSKEISYALRHALKDGKIRAFYGHSIPMKILREEQMPPDVLYHGTARRKSMG